MFIKLWRWFKKRKSPKNQHPTKRDKDFRGLSVINLEGLTGRINSGYYINGTRMSVQQYQMFLYLWNNTSFERTEELAEIFIRLAKAK